MPITAGGKFNPDNNIVSPGVFTRELDQSGLAQGVANIGGAIVAPFAKGPAFSPTLVTDVNELESKFGVADGVYYGPYTAKQYLQEQGRVTVCRVGALTGYYQKNPLVIYALPGYYERWKLGAPIGTSSLDNNYLKDTTGATSDPNVFLTYNISGSNKSLTASAEVILTFSSVTSSWWNPSSSKYQHAGETTVVGTITAEFDSIHFWITSSIESTNASGTDKLFRALAESTSNTSLLTASAASIKVTAGTEFADVNDLYITNAVFAAYRSSGGCGTVFYLVSGSISGSFGDFNGRFQSAGGANISDPCNPPSTGSTPRILAVLANTRFTNVASDLTLPGFSGSTLVTASGFAIGDMDYSLTLHDSGGTTFGIYDFSLDPDSSKYITSVFGKDATAGNPDTYVQGQKKEAAYLYSIFEDSIASVVSNPDEWYITATTDDIAGISNGIPIDGTVNKLQKVGEMLNFTDEGSFDIVEKDSAFSITNA